MYQGIVSLHSSSAPLFTTLAAIVHSACRPRRSTHARLKPHISANVPACIAATSKCPLDQCFRCGSGRVKCVKSMILRQHVMTLLHDCMGMSHLASELHCCPSPGAPLQCPSPGGPLQVPPAKARWPSSASPVLMPWRWRHACSGQGGASSSTGGRTPTACTTVLPSTWRRQYWMRYSRCVQAARC
jgi:hypothetical protein